MLDVKKYRFVARMLTKNPLSSPLNPKNFFFLNEQSTELTSFDVIKLANFDFIKLANFFDYIKLTNFFDYIKLTNFSFENILLKRVIYYRHRQA